MSVAEIVETERLVEWLSSLPEDELAAYFEQLSEGERDWLANEIAAAEWRATPATMSVHLSRGRVQSWAYWRLLGMKFRQAVTGESKRQIWNMPARLGKSFMASQWGPTWALDRDPTLPIILTSYGDALAVENAIAVRDNLRNHSDVLRAQLRPDRQEQGRFVTTEGGGILARGLLSGISGFGARGVVIDDPFKNWQEAHSEARRDLVDHEYRAVIRLRLDDEDAWVIIVHTRWHENDLSGRLLGQMEDGTGEEWELVRLPMIAEAPDPRSPHAYMRLPDPLGRKPGAVIEPEKFTIVAAASRALALGSYLTSAMEQQRPAPEEGGELKRAWWKLETRMPEKADEWLTSWDMKLKDKETGDYVVGQIWARTGKDCWLVDQLRGRWNFSTTTNAIALMYVRYPKARRHWIENTGNGPEVMTALRTPTADDWMVSEDDAGTLGMTEEERVAVSKLRRRGMTGILPENPKGSKVARARAVSGAIEGGDVHLPERASWLGEFLDETANFPNGTHDDQVDAMSQALAKLHRISIEDSLQVPEGRVPSTKPSDAAKAKAVRPPAKIVVPAHMRSVVEAQLRRR